MDTILFSLLLVMIFTPLILISFIGLILDSFEKEEITRMGLER